MAASAVGGGLIDYVSNKIAGVKNTSFSWKAVAATAVTDIISSSLENINKKKVSLDGTKPTDLDDLDVPDTFLGDVAKRFNRGVIGLHVRRKFGFDDKVDYGNILASSLAGAAGTKIGGDIREAKLHMLLEEADAAASMTGVDNAKIADSPVNEDASNKNIGVPATTELESVDKDVMPSLEEQRQLMLRAIAIFKEMRRDGVLDESGLYDNIDEVKSKHPNAFIFHFDPERKLDKLNVDYSDDIAHVDDKNFTGIYFHSAKSLRDALDTVLHEIAHLDNKMYRLWNTTKEQIENGYEPYNDTHSPSFKVPYTVAQYQSLAHFEIKRDVKIILEKYYEKYVK